jgi:hypothetical protein
MPSIAWHDKSQLQQILFLAIEREAGTVRPSMLAAIEHFDQRFAYFVVARLLV